MASGRGVIVLEEQIKLFCIKIFLYRVNVGNVLIMTRICDSDYVLWFYFNFWILVFQRLDRIRASMRQLEGREISFEQKLRETFIKRNECVKNTNCLIKKLEEHGTNIQLQQEVANLHFQVGLNITYTGYSLLFSSAFADDGRPRSGRRQEYTLVWTWVKKL